MFYIHVVDEMSPVIVKSGEESKSSFPLLQLENEKYCTWSAKWTLRLATEPGACEVKSSRSSQVQSSSCENVPVQGCCFHKIVVPVWSPALIYCGAVRTFHCVGCCDILLGVTMSCCLSWPCCWDVMSEFFWKFLARCCFLQLQLKVWPVRMTRKDVWLLWNPFCEGIVNC